MPAMDYGVLAYGDMNWLAVFCAGLAYWLLGAIWYSAIFSKMWRSAVEAHGVKVCQPNQGGMGIKLIVTLVCNLIAALVLARVIHQVGHHMDLLRGLKIGAGVGPRVLRDGIDDDLRLAIATAKTLGHRYRLPYRRLHDHGCNPGSLAVAGAHRHHTRSTKGTKKFSTRPLWLA